MRPATRRRLMGRPTFHTELELHRIDCMACHGKVDNYTLLLDYLHELAHTPPVPEPLLNGRDLLALGLKPGPRVGELLSEALDLQMEDAFADREAALAWLRDRLATDAADE
jgi:poly(A) polymerase